MNMGIYEADCEFADPFVSFKGLKRFKQNVSNLGSFMEESSLKITDWQEYEVQNPLQKLQLLMGTTYMIIIRCRFLKSQDCCTIWLFHF